MKWLDRIFMSQRVFIAVMVVLISLTIFSVGHKAVNGCKCKAYATRLHMIGKTMIPMNDCVKWECKDKKDV